MKRLVQDLLRAVHVRWGRPGLPNRLGVYFHALEPPDYDAFRTAITLLRTVGYRTVADPAHLLEPGPEKRAWLSFDDNYRSWHTALPLLAELDVRATFYVNTGVFRDEADAATLAAYFDRIDHHGDRQTMTRAELRDLAAAGHVVGAHTHTHRPLSALPRDEAREEIRRSKAELEDTLGLPVRHFSYPFGFRRHFSEALRAYCLEEAGFETVAQAIPALQHAGQTAEALQRSGWHFRYDAARNLADLAIDGRRFERWTGRSAIG